jgi:imidazolonepropionase-like amidohydrolase
MTTSHVIPGSKLAVCDARLIDGDGESIVDKATVIIADGRIDHVGPSNAAPRLDDVDTIIDGAGRTLIPGLIDCHVHLCFDGSPDLPDDPPQTNAAWAAVKASMNARRALESGVTAVRDLGGNGTALLAIARAKRLGLIEAPLILTAAQLITAAGGHGHSLGRTVESPSELPEAVRDLVRDGADVIKLIATAGALTPGIADHPPVFRAAEMAAAVAEAHKARLRVAAHAINAQGVLAALEAGVDSVEHACWISEAGLELMSARRAWLVATMLAAVRVAAGGPDVAPEIAAKAQGIVAAHRESFRRIIGTSARVAAGTDAGTPLNAHGSLAEELRLMHEAGLPLSRVLASATGEAAALLGLTDAGRLAVGSAADVVLLDGDPLADVGAYHRVSLVVQRGRIVADRLRENQGAGLVTAPPPRGTA